MAVSVVMPCLNEEAGVEQAARSLGFGAGALPAKDDVDLVLVDNGSTDGTLDAMERVARGSRPGCVVIVEEAERGFVPPRRRGVGEVRRLGRGEARDSLILQADADTTYLPGFVERMREAAAPGLLLEGSAGRLPEFAALHPGYVALEREVDLPTRPLDVEDEFEVVVDDKVCAYRLEDYECWGGHRREFCADGSEVHAETTRMLMSARASGLAVRRRVERAGALTSRRRVEEDPALQFAASGFPREASWIAAWSARHPSRWDVDAFASARSHVDVQDAMASRRAHAVALFAVLPRLVAAALGELPRGLPDGIDAAFGAMEPPTIAQMISSPATVLLSVLAPTTFGEAGVHVI